MIHIQPTIMCFGNWDLEIFFLMFLMIHLLYTRCCFDKRRTLSCNGPTPLLEKIIEKLNRRLYKTDFIINIF